MPAIKLIFSLWFITMGWQAQAVPQPIAEYHKQYKSLLGQKNLPMVILLVQPKCQWCHKLWQALHEQNQSAKHQTLVVLATQAHDYKAVKREYKKLPESGKVFVVDKRFLRTHGGFAAAPTSYWFDEAREYLATYRGYMQPQKLTKVLSILHHAEDL